LLFSAPLKGAMILSLALGPAAMERRIAEEGLPVGRGVSAQRAPVGSPREPHHR
jgi:hypothetical protein